MSGFDQWLSGSLSSVTGASALPVWAAGALAALLFFVGVLAFARAAQIGRAGVAWRVALLLVGAGSDVGAGGEPRRARSVRRAPHAGRPRGGTDAARHRARFAARLPRTVANETIEAACEKLLFASPETIAAAVAYVDARLTLLADGSRTCRARPRLRGFDRALAPLHRGGPLRRGRACARHPRLHGGELRGVEAAARSAAGRRQSARAQFRRQCGAARGGVECPATSGAGGRRAGRSARSRRRLSVATTGAAPPPSGQVRVSLRGFDPSDQHHECRAGRSLRGESTTRRRLRASASPPRRPPPARNRPRRAARRPAKRLRRSSRRSSRARRPRRVPLAAAGHAWPIRASVCLTSRSGGAVMRRHVFIRPDRQPRRNRMPGGAHRVAARLAHHRGLFGSRCQRAARAAVRRGVSDRSGAGAGKLSRHRQADRRRAPRARRMHPSRLRLSVGECRISPRPAQRPASFSSGRRLRRCAPWDSRIAPRR